MLLIGFGGGKKKRKAPKSLLSHGGSVPRVPLNAQPKLKTTLLFQQYGINPKNYRSEYSSIESIFRQWQKMEQTGDYSKQHSLNNQLTSIFQRVLDKEAK